MKRVAAAVAVIGLSLSSLALLVSCLSPEERARRSATVTANARCHVCHMNFQDEKLAVWHEKAGIACTDCHGKSSAHSSDENNTTAPDILFARAAIKPACMKCHPETQIARKSQHKEMLAGTSDKVCTDCHGNHRLPTRTIRWDKTTRKLLKN